MMPRPTTANAILRGVGRRGKIPAAEVRFVVDLFARYGQRAPAIREMVFMLSMCGQTEVVDAIEALGAADRLTHERLEVVLSERNQRQQRAESRADRQPRRFA